MRSPHSKSLLTGPPVAPKPDTRHHPYGPAEIRQMERIQCQWQGAIALDQQLKPLHQYCTLPYSTQVFRNAKESRPD